MSRWGEESSEERQGRRREERREFAADVAYEAWRHGYNPDRARECADDCYEAGRSAQACAGDYMRHERQAREERRAEEDEAQRQEYLQAQYAREDEERYREIEEEMAREAAAPAQRTGEP